MKDGLSAETLGKIIADAERRGAEAERAMWEEGIAQVQHDAYDRGAEEMRERAKAECERHAKFCKEEADKGGDRPHLMARFEEATYNAKRIGSLPLAPEEPT